jgi:hypothetical protein
MTTREEIVGRFEAMRQQEGIETAATWTLGLIAHQKVGPETKEWLTDHVVAFVVPLKYLGRGVSTAGPLEDNPAWSLANRIRELLPRYKGAKLGRKARACFDRLEAAVAGGLPGKES